MRSNPPRTRTNLWSLPLRRWTTGAALVVAVLAPTPALAQYVGTPTPVVDGTEVQRCAPGSTDPSCVVVMTAAFERPAVDPTDETLPVTGGDIVGLTGIGIGAVSLGALMVRRGRRPASN